MTQSPLFVLFVSCVISICSQRICISSFIRAVLARTGTPLVLDYVRLNMVARRAGETR